MEHDSTRKTYAGHGKPNKLCYHGKFGSLEPREVLIASSGGMVTLTDAATGNGVDHFGAATKFWAHPMETPAPVPVETATTVATDALAQMLPGLAEPVTPTHNHDPRDCDDCSRRYGTARPEVWFTPAVVPGQEFRRVPDAYVVQLLAILDSGTMLELHPDGFWRDRHGLTGPMLDTAGLRDAVADATDSGLVYQMPAQGRHIANPTLYPGPIHQVLHGSRGAVRPLCVGPDHSGHLVRFRLTDKADRVTCEYCKRETAAGKARWDALEKIMIDRGIFPGAKVTIPGGAAGRVYTVNRVDGEDVTLTFPKPDHSGDLVETGWRHWTILVPVAPVAPTPVADDSPWAAQVQRWTANYAQRTQR